MNFSGIPEKSLIGKLLRLPLKLLPGNAQVRILQGKLRGKRWIVGSGNHGYWLGSYELEKQQVVIQRIMPGSVVYDIGGNVGFYTLLASVLVGDSGKVISFEPLPRNIYYLKEHIRINQIRNVTVFDAAVSNEEGSVHFDERPNPSMGKITSTGALTVKTVVLDKLYQNQQIAAPDYMKIDVEGAELAVLLGAKSILETLHPTIFLATHGSKVQRECVQLLNTFDYQIHIINKDIYTDQSEEILAFYHEN